MTSDTDISIGDIVRAAAHLGRAFPILYFPNPDSAPVRYVVVDVERGFQAVECSCGIRPKVIYSTDRNGLIVGTNGRPLVGDGMQWVSLSCGNKTCHEYGKAITISCGGQHFKKASGAMGSLARSWWNATKDKENHPDDFGNGGGILVEWENFYNYMNPPQSEATDPAEPETVEGEENASNS